MNGNHSVKHMKTSKLTETKILLSQQNQVFKKTAKNQQSWV